MSTKTNNAKRRNPNRGSSKKNDFDMKAKSKYAADRKNCKGRKDIGLSDEGDTRNDPSWYISNESLLKAGASFPYGYPVGAPAYLDNDIYSHAGKLVVSGICVLDLLPTIGVSQNAASPVNVAARKLYSYIRHANSGASNYDAPDLMMYMIAMDAMYSWYWNGVRAYGTVNLYNKQNRYVPDALIHALGFDPDDLRRNYAQLRYGLIALAMKINNLVVPNTMTIFERHRWCFSHLWTDGTAPKAQLYAFRPKGYYVFAKDSNGAGKLKWNSVSYATEVSSDVKPMTVNDYLDIMYAMVDPVITNYDEDFGIMSGDIMKAYDANQLYTLPAIAEDYSVVPEYDETVLSQFQNATITGLPLLGSMDITQVVDPDNINAGALLYNPKWPRLTTGSGGKSDLADYVNTYAADVNGPEYDLRCMDRLISLNKDDPSPADTLEATRLTVTMEPVANSQAMQLSASGTEIAVLGTIYRFKYANDGKRSMSIRTFKLANYIPYFSGNGAIQYVPSSGSPTQIDSVNTYGWSDLIDIFGDLIRLSHFKFHPLMIICLMQINGNATLVSTDGHTIVKADNATFSNVTNFFGMEIDNYTILSADDLQQLHEIATLGEFNI